MNVILSHAAPPFARRLVQAAVVVLGLACGSAAQAAPVVSDHATGQAPFGDFVVHGGQRVVFDLDVTAYLPLDSFGIFFQVGPIVFGQDYEFEFWNGHGSSGGEFGTFGVHSGPSAQRNLAFGMVGGSGIYNSWVADDGLFSLAFNNRGSGDIGLRLMDVVITTPQGRFDVFDPVAAPVPEPATWALFGVAGLAALATRRRRA